MLNEEKKIASQTFRLSHTLDEQLRCVAQARGVDVGDLIRSILKKSMSIEKTKFDYMVPVFGDKKDNV